MSRSLSVVPYADNATAVTAVTAVTLGFDASNWTHKHWEASHSRRDRKKPSTCDSDCRGTLIEHNHAEEPAHSPTGHTQEPVFNGLG